MELTKILTNRNTILEIDDARIIFRNFSGAGDRYNREGDRNFALVFDDEDMVNELVEDGWNIKIKTSDEYEKPSMTMKVKIKFNDHGPKCYLYSGKKRIQLTEDTIGMIDDISIERIDMDIRSYDWENNGKTGRTAYLQGLRVYQRIDRFTADFEDDDLPV